MSEKDMKAFKVAPSWSGRVAAALTGQHSADPSKADVDVLVPRVFAEQLLAFLRDSAEAERPAPGRRRFHQPSRDYEPAARLDD